MTGQRRVLVVDDETSLADLYALWLADGAEVATAYGGGEALERVDANTDVVVLDRRMPRVSGDEVLGTIRNRSLDCRVAMVTAVDPDMDILDLEFDAYLPKAVSKDDLTTTVDRLARCSEYDTAVRRYLSLTAKRDALEATKPLEVLDSSDAYADLLAEIDALETRDAVADVIDDGSPDPLSSNP